MERKDIMKAVIVPAYQPDETLEAVADQLWVCRYQIIVVDDGSGEEYRQIFERIKDICVVLTHSVNRGKGAAIKTALRYIQKEMWDCKEIAVMDADGQHLTEDLAGLFACSEAHQRTLVLGVRTIGKEMPLRSRLGNQITRIVFQLVSGVKVSDTQTGLRAFGVDLVPELLQVEGDRYEYETNMLMAFARKGIPIAEVPIHTIYRDRNNSSSHFCAFRDSVRIYRDIFRFTLSSLSSFVLDYLLFMIFTLIVPHTSGWILLANIAARLVSAFYNYAMNCHFVFHTGKKRSTALRYFALTGCILAMNSLVLDLLVHRLHFPVYLAKLLTECVLFLVSWLIQNNVIFRGKGGTGCMDGKVCS